MHACIMFSCVGLPLARTWSAEVWVWFCTSHDGQAEVIDPEGSFRFMSDLLQRSVLELCRNPMGSRVDILRRDQVLPITWTQDLLMFSKEGDIYRSNAIFGS